MMSLNHITLVQYILLSPVSSEPNGMAQSLESNTSPTILPEEWITVDEVFFDNAFNF